MAHLGTETETRNTGKEKRQRKGRDRDGGSGRKMYKRDSDRDSDKAKGRDKRPRQRRGEDIRDHGKEGERTWRIAPNSHHRHVGGLAAAAECTAARHCKT